MDLPTYSNSEGEVILLNQMGLLNDFFAYNEEMHFELITEVKGVTLERINYQLGDNSDQNWHSASSTSGYATPGFQNSQYLKGNTANGEVTVLPKTFSPNNDGYKDNTSISYLFENGENVATVSIHNDQGQLIKTLINNQSIGSSGEITWDGTNERNEILPTGMYIIVFRTFDLENNQSIFKNVVVLALP
jgi:gliding motility-associated-like protein